MSYALQRLSSVWDQYNANPCAKTMLGVARTLAQHHYDSRWAGHAWVENNAWLDCPWRIRWHSALMASLRKSNAVATPGNPRWTRLCAVAQWVEKRECLRDKVSSDGWCKHEWWLVGKWLDQMEEPIEGMSAFVSMWDPVWAIAAPLHAPLGWQQGLWSLHQSVHAQGVSSVDSVTGSMVLSNAWS